MKKLIFCVLLCAVQCFAQSKANLANQVQGVLPVANGGTGNSTVTVHGSLVGNGTSPMTVVAPGTSGYCWTSNGVSSDPSWQVCGAGGTAGVASINGLAGTPSITAGSGISISVSGSNIQVTNTSGGGFPFGGDGVDGAVTADGTTTVACLGAPSSSIYTMTRNCYFTTLTVNSGVTVITSNFAFYVQGTLTNAGTIHNNGGNGTGGGNAQFVNQGGSGGATAAFVGNGTAQFFRWPQGTAGASGAGGGTGAGTQAGTASATITTSCVSAVSPGVAGGTGASGGAGGSANGGGTAGGTSRTGGTGASAPSVLVGIGRSYSESVMGAVSYWNSGTASLNNYLCAGSYAGGAPGGSSGAGDGTNNGGGGGGGGGMGAHGGFLSIYAKTISNSGTISVNGGQGGGGGTGGSPTAGNAGGGGGGAGGSGGVGGLLWLVYQSLTNTGTISAGGGLGGAAGTAGTGHGTGANGTAGGAGTAGAAGLVIYLPVS